MNYIRENINFKILDKILPIIVLRNRIFSFFTKKFDCKIIMILGYQRSGTSALGVSFSSDKNYKLFDESYYSQIMKKWLLRPEKEIRYLLNKEKKIILKPISENYNRTSSELFEEFNNYNCKFIFIYRDVENVYYSNNEHDKSYYNDDISKFIKLYNKRMENSLDGLDIDNGIFVKYEELIKNKESYKKICNYLEIKGQYIFRSDSKLGTKNLKENELKILKIGTQHINNKIENLVLKSNKKLGIN